MAGETMRFRNPAGHAGLLNNLVALTNSLAGFFETRLSLFARESKAALVHLLVLAGSVVAALVLLAIRLRLPDRERDLRDRARGSASPGSGSRSRRRCCTLCSLWSAA